MKVFVAVLVWLALLKSFSIAQQRFVCYFPNWTTYRKGDGKFTVDNIDSSLCTHYIYAFAILDEVNWGIKIFDPYADIDLGGYANFNAMKQKNPGLKTMIAIGGWTDSEVSGTGPGKYSQLVSDPNKIRTFVSSVMTFLNQYGFDGLDLDWEYPGKYPGGEGDKKGFTDLCKALRTEFDSKEYLLSAAVAANEEIILKGYETEALTSLDFVNIMTYDMHGQWEPKTDNHAPLYKREWETENNNVDYIVTDVYIGKLQVPNFKLNLGIPMYGKSWTLSSDETGIGAPAWGDGGAPGPFTNASGTLAYNEICHYLVQNIGWTLKQSGDDYTGPYAYSGAVANKTWVGYDDVDTVIKKTEYAKSKELGGVMVWELSNDDFGNLCGSGKNPLGSAISRTAFPDGLPTPSTTPPTTTTGRTTTVPGPTQATTPKSTEHVTTVPVTRGSTPTKATTLYPPSTARMVTASASRTCSISFAFLTMLGLVISTFWL